MFHNFGGNVARAETQQWHGFHAQGGDDNLAWLSIRDGQSIIADDFHYDEFRVYMTAKAVLAFREGRAHLCRRIGGEELYIPFFLDFASEQVEVKVLVAESLADAYDATDATISIINTMIFSILYQLQDERWHTHDGVGLDATNGVPLQFGDAIANANDTCAHFTKAKKISQTRHETFVESGH